MELRKAILEVVMKNVYCRQEYAEELTDKIIKSINKWKDNKKTNQI